LVLNFILGGSKGYDEGMLMSILKTPPVYICACVHTGWRCWRSQAQAAGGLDPILSHSFPQWLASDRTGLGCPVLTLVGRPVRPHDGPLQVVQAIAHRPVRFERDNIAWGSVSLSALGDICLCKPTHKSIAAQPLNPRQTHVAVTPDF
jgi:hypothetical protein